MIKLLLIILIISLPFQFALNVGENIDLVTTRVLIPVVFLLWLIKNLARKELRIPNAAEMWLIISFLFLVSLSLVLGRDAGAGARKLLYLFTIFPVFFIASDIFRDEKWRKRAIAAVFLSGALSAAVALIQFSLPFFLGIGKAVKSWENLAPFFLGNSFGELVAANSSWLVNIAGETKMRAFGFFPDPHMFSFFANLSFFTGLGHFFYKKKIWVGAGLLLTLIATIFSFSRGAYLGLLAGIFFFVIMILKRSKVSKKAIAGIGAILILIAVFNSGAIFQRLASSFNLKEGSNAERYKNWTEAVDIIRDYPLGGVGLGNYARAVDPSSADRSSIYAHNLFLDIAAETGILNAVAFLFLIIFSIWRNIKNNNIISLGLASGLVAFFIHSMFDTALWSPQVMVVFLTIVAIGLNVSSKCKAQNSK
jgi:O-antigen ligase